MFICTRIRLITRIVLLGTLVLVGCDTNDTSDPEYEIAQLVISPDSASIAVGDQVDFSAVALTASGDTVPNADLAWETSDADVFSVEENGLATGLAPGTAFCVVSGANLIGFTGRDSAFVSVF